MIRKVFSFMILCSFLIFPTEVCAGNAGSKDFREKIYFPPDNKMLGLEYDLVVYLVGGPETSKIGMQNLGEYLNLKIRKDLYYSSIYEIYPYADGTKENDPRPKLESDPDGKKGAEEIYKEMLRQNPSRTPHLAIKRFKDALNDEDHPFSKRKDVHVYTKYLQNIEKNLIKSRSRAATEVGSFGNYRVCQYPIFIVHGTAGSAAHYAIQNLQDHFSLLVDRLVLIGTKRLPKPYASFFELGTTYKDCIPTMYICDKLDPIFKYGDWGNDEWTYPKISTLSLTVPRGISSAKVLHENFLADANSSISLGKSAFSSSGKKEVAIDYTASPSTYKIGSQSSRKILVDLPSQRTSTPNTQTKGKNKEQSYFPDIQLSHMTQSNVETAYAFEREIMSEENEPVDVNRSYFFTSLLYRDKKDITNLEKTVEAFYEFLDIGTRYRENNNYHFSLNHRLNLVEQEQYFKMWKELDDFGYQPGMGQARKTQTSYERNLRAFNNKYPYPYT